MPPGIWLLFDVYLESLGAKDLLAMLVEIQDGHRFVEDQTNCVVVRGGD